MNAPDSQTRHFSARRLAIAGLVGNVLEWYDFSVYGFFAPAIGVHFFPARRPLASLLAAFGVFAAGFLTRPLGALLFGYVGDNHGRERALTWSVLAMAIPTTLIGLLPDYQQIGPLASVLMVTLRLTQGLSVGGEYTTSVVCLIERSTPERRAFMGSFSVIGAFGGVLLGSAVGMIVTLSMSPDTARAWGWRLPFIAGSSLGAVGFMIRREFQRIGGAHEPERIPLTEVIRNWRTVAQITAFKMLNAVGFYLIFIYLTTYLTDIIHLPKARALEINTLSMAIVLGVLPAAAILSDRIGRKPMLLGASLAALILGWPLFHLMQHPIFRKPLEGQLGFALIIALFMGVEPAASAEAFPGRVRCTGTAISHNLCMALFGGTAPMVATYLIMRTHHDMSPVWYLMGAAGVSVLATLSLGETAKVPLSE